MSERITVTMSMIPPGMVGDCTLVLHDGDKNWWKTYRSERELWDEAKELELVSSRPVQTGRYTIATELSFLAKSSVSTEDLEARGFHLRDK